MESKVVNRIIRGAHCVDIELLHDASYRKVVVLLELSVGFFVNSLCVLGVEYLMDSEIALEFKVSPVVERISQCMLHGVSPCKELIKWICILSGYQLFFHPIGAHRTPFVVITSKPSIGNGHEALVLSNLLWIEVTVIVKDHLVFCILMIQLLGCLGL